MHAVPLRPVDRTGFLGFGLALGYLVAAQPTLASLRQPATSPEDRAITC